MYLSASWLPTLSHLTSCTPIKYHLCCSCFQWPESSHSKFCILYQFASSYITSKNLSKTSDLCII